MGVNSNSMSQVVKNEPIVTQSTVLTGEQIKMALKNGCRIIDSNGVEVNLGTAGDGKDEWRDLQSGFSSGGGGTSQSNSNNQSSTGFEHLHSTGGEQTNAFQ